MKVEVVLSDKEVAGIKSYLSETEGKASNNDVRLFIRGIVDGYLNNTQDAVCDHIQAQSN